MIKARPEDFVVDERADLPLEEFGPYRVYLLTKNGWTTLDILRRLARVCGVSPEAVSYGGKKDKHGLTSQFIAIRDERDFSREERGFRLEAKGFMGRPMGPDLIKANAFRVVVRDLARLEGVEAGLEAVSESGFPNFFDDQRFRSYDPERGFFAEKVMRRHYNGALQVYATSLTPEMSGPERTRRRALFEHWKDWPACRKLAADREEREIFEFLAAFPQDVARALHKLPQDEISMRYSSFQSHLWNELLRVVIREAVPHPIAVPGAEGPYLFWERLEGEPRDRLFGLDLPTAATRMAFPDDRTRDIFAAVLRGRDLKFGDFRTRALRKVYFKSFPRRAAIIPRDLAILEKGADEFHPSRFAITLSFVLPRGSYATMLIRRLTLWD
jgi:tRNA pseudouridine13 synthase